MKYLKIKLEDNKIILVDESAEIKENTYYENNGVIFLSDSVYNKGNNPNNSNPRVTDFNNKITATINHSISLDVPMVIVEDEVEKLAKECFREIYNTEFIGIPTHYELLSVIYKALIYKAVQQKVYSEEGSEDELWGKIFAIIKQYGLNNDVLNRLKNDFSIQSLNQEYIELESESYLTDKEERCEGLKKDGENIEKQVVFKTNRVDGQLMAYVKK